MTGLQELGVGTCGVWTRGQARAVLSASQVRSMLRGPWQVVLPGVYADSGHVLDAEQRAFAAVLTSGGAGQPLPFGAPDPETGVRPTRLRAVACGRTSARVHGLPLIDDDDPATGACEAGIDDVATWTDTRTLRHAGRELRRHELTFGRGEVGRLPSGLWITSPLRTLVDCARLLTHDALVCALDDALHRELVTPEQLAAAVIARRGLAGGPALRRGVGLADGRAESPAETLARLLLLPVLPSLVPQVRLFDAHGRLVARFDLGDKRDRFAVEADGARGHAGGQMVAKDRRRDRRTGAIGWATERVTWFELRRQQAALRARVIAAHTSHVARP